MCSAFLALWLLALKSSCATFLEPHGEHCERAHSSKFDDFINAHGRNYKPGSEEYEHRRGLFTKRLAAVHAHNCRRHRSWKASVNAFADRTHRELADKLGWNRAARPMRGAQVRDGLELMLGTAGQPTTQQPTALVATPTELPTNVSWAHLPAMKDVKDQGTCGSCWAFASATVLRAHHEIHRGEDREFSPQELVSCVDNPRHCGGDGGCAGATAELAMEYVLHHGLRREADFAYEAFDDKCPNTLKQGGITGHSLGMVAWETLSSNAAKPLMKALVDLGPVAVSVAADDAWFMYQQGIMDSCKNDNPVVNHAVVAIGYGVDRSGVGFWELQNSWGQSWGENGHIKLLRRDEDERDWCGWDTEPEKGVACQDDHSSKVWVCGMCGVLYDSVVPHFERVPAQPAARTLARYETAHTLDSVLEPLGSAVRHILHMN